MPTMCGGYTLIDGGWVIVEPDLAITPPVEEDFFGDTE